MMSPAVLFVCLGNICRSPLAEAACRQAADAAGLDVKVDSAGTGSWHIGHPPDPRAIAEAERHGIDISGYRGRQVNTSDFDRFDYIFALDDRNLADLQALVPPDSQARVGLLLDLVPSLAGQAVADPYFGEAQGFETTWHEVSLAARALVEKLQASN
jgi:protein-tyrosine phosphatase